MKGQRRNFFVISGPWINKKQKRQPVLALKEKSRGHRSLEWIIQKSWIITKCHGNPSKSLDKKYTLTFHWTYSIIQRALLLWWYQHFCIVSPRCPCKRKNKSPLLPLENLHWRFSYRHLVCICIICKHPHVLRFFSNVVAHQSSLTFLCLISLFSLSLWLWLTALFSCVCFVLWFSFVSRSFPSLTGDFGREKKKVAFRLGCNQERVLLP